MIGDKTAFLDTGLEEVEETTVFCQCGHSKKIPVDFNFSWQEWRACDRRDLTCEKCGEEMYF